MLSLIIRKEILSHILSLRFTVTFILFIVLVFASFYVTVNEYLLEVKRHDSRVRVYRDKLSSILAEKQDWGAHGRLERLFWNEGKNDAVPASPLGWMAQGLQPVLPAGVRTTTHDTRNIDRGPTRNPLLGLLSTPDFVYVVNVVLSLLAILFMFDAVCGEKEAGTLRLALSNSVPRHSILLGKWLGGYIVLLVPFLVAVAGGIGYAWVKGAFDPTGDGMVRVLAVVALACFYIAVFFNLSLFISTTTHNSATSLLVCLLVWVVFTLAVPNLAPATAKILEPTPSLQKIEAEKRAIDEEIRLKRDRLTATSGELGYGDKIEKEKEKLERERKRLHRQWDNFYKGACDRQMGLAQTFGRVSPSASWIYASAALTNTGPKVYERLEAATKRTLAAFKDFEDGFWKSRRSDGKKRTEIRADQLPSLKLTFPTTKQVVEHSLNDVLLLVILNVVFFMLAFVFFLRYDVR